MKVNVIWQSELKGLNKKLKTISTLFWKDKKNRRKTNEINYVICKLQCAMCMWLHVAYV